MRRHDGTAGQTHWVAWLKGKARDRGYDVDEHGGKARLADATGIAPATISRTFKGVVPEYDTLRTLARHLGIDLDELLVRTGKATPDDFAAEGSYTERSRVLSEKPLTPDEVADRAGVPPEHRAWFANMVRQLRQDETTGGSTTGGAVAEG